MSKSPWSGDNAEVAHRDACGIDHILTTSVVKDVADEYLVRIEVVMSRREYTLSAAWVHLSADDLDGHLRQIIEMRDWLRAKKLGDEK